MRDNWYDFEPSVPIPVKGGIKLADKNRPGSNWWAGQWLQALNRSGLGARLSRGKSYASRGQVFALDISPGMITASIQGSRRTPYRVSIGAKPVPPNTRKHMLAWLSRQVGFGAQLLVGVLPKNLESLFTDAGVWLFPPNYSAFSADCSCPDWANPCKHLAAVFMLLAQEFDRDPLLLLKFRGFEREEILQGLGVTATPSIREIEEQTLTRGELCDIHSFWVGSKSISPNTSEEVVSDAHGPLLYLRQIGHFPMWRGEKPLRAVLEPLYIQAAAKVTSTKETV